MLRTGMARLLSHAGMAVEEAGVCAAPVLPVGSPHCLAPLCRRCGDCWHRAARKETVEKGKNDRQDKRTENIKERTQAKIEKKLKKKVRGDCVGRSAGEQRSCAARVSRCFFLIDVQGGLQRAGFEGRKKEFLNE